MISPAQLALRLGALEVTPGALRCDFSRVPIRGYPGGRPSTILTIADASGRFAGRGEYIAFVEAEHAAFAQKIAQVASQLRAVKTTVATVAASLGVLKAEPAAGAAVEGALLDLALRQQGLSLADLTGVEVASLEYVISFDAAPEPALRALAIRATNPSARFKIDVALDWTQTEIAALAALDGIAILDFKGRGTANLARMLRHHFPRAVFEDPPPGAPLAQVSRDLPLRRTEDVTRAVEAGEGVNLKAPRKGGFLEVLRSLEATCSSRAPVYFGGMFEVSVGRRQAQALAALYAAEAPNDLAPIPLDENEARAPSPLTIDLRVAGFGGEAA